MIYGQGSWNFMDWEEFTIGEEEKEGLTVENMNHRCFQVELDLIGVL